MTPEQMIGQFEVLTKTMVEKMRAKNADYARGSDAFKNFRRHGVYGIVIRMDDKISRMDSLTNPVHTDNLARVTDESVEDTAMDLATYSLLLILLRREMSEGQVLKHRLNAGTPRTATAMRVLSQEEAREASCGRPAALERET